MGDVLPPKRQNVVDRLRVRLERYRWHHNSCLPRYEQSANSVCEKQRQDTVRLRQKFLEPKAKKTKSSKSDHHRTTSAAAREPTPDTQKLISQAKPVKVLAEGSPANSTPDIPSDDIERPVKIQKENPLAKESSKNEPTKTANFALQISQQFSKCNPPVQPLNAATEPSSSQQKANATNQATSALSRTTPKEIVATIECKQEVEKPPDLCDFKNTSQDNVSSDRLSDTFPSFAFPEDSGDDVIHPDILKDLIDDVFTNSADIMKDFNFGDAVSNMKDDDKVEIGDLVKSATPELQMQTFRADTLMFSNHSITQDHQSDVALFENCSTTSTTSSIPSLSVTSPAALPVSNSSLFKSQQNLPNYSSVNNLNMGLEFKLTEPSPAAFTLKQMAEQHQNMQQKQQQLNASFGARNSFAMNNFSDPYSAKYISQPSLKIPNSSMFQSSAYDAGNSYPGVVAINNNNNGNTFKKELCSTVPNRLVGNMVAQKSNNLHWLPNDQKKHVAGVGQMERVNFYPNQNSQNVVSSQYTPLEVQLQMHQNQQILHPSQNVITEDKQLENRYPNMYSYNVQQGNKQVYNLPQNQQSYSSYSMLPNNARPPPEYKSHEVVQTVPQQQFQPMPYQPVARQVPSNAGGNQWWVPQQQNQAMTNMYQQQQDSYANLNCTGSISSNVSHSNMHHPYRITGHRVPPPNVTLSNHSMLQQRTQQQQRPINSNITSMDINLSQVYNIQQELGNRQDNHINLDFLDHIESSASDLLNFDQVMQNTETTHFQLLDDMEMLSK